MDECFNDFLTDAERHTRKDLLESNPGLIILRAYTKMYAVPGVRFGWCMTADAALIEKLYHAGQPWNVSVIAQACAVAAANEPDWATETAKRIAEERRFLSDGLAACGLTVFPGEANFLLFRSNDTGLHEKLAEYGIMIRNCDNYRGLSAGYYRVAVKTREASKCLLNAIKLIMENG
ncbi:MAG: aminotransferase class I/II-fold pyridoxal phosphate-dependent enzyme [Butyricicoccus sp.]